MSVESVFGELEQITGVLTLRDGRGPCGMALAWNEDPVSWSGYSIRGYEIEAATGRRGRASIAPKVTFEGYLPKKTPHTARGL